MVQSVWEKREWQLRRSEDRISKKIKVKVVSIWWDGVKRIYSDVKRRQEVSIDDGETDVKIRVEIKKRWGLNMIFWVAWRMKYDWRK